MGLISCTEINQPRNGSINQKYETSYSRTFQAIYSDATYGSIDATLSVNIGIGDYYDTGYEFDTTAFCTDITANCTVEDGKKWLITVNYGKWDAIEPNPMDEPYEVGYDFEQFEKPCDQDIYGAAVVNSAGDSFDPGLTKDDSRPVLTITRNESTFDAQLAYMYRDCVNSGTFSGADPDTVKVVSIGAKSAYDQTYGAYWTVTYVFAFNPDTWKKTVLNQGLRKKVGTKREQIIIQGSPATSPVFLDNAGTPMDPGTPATFLTFEVYNRQDFDVFNF